MIEVEVPREWLRRRGTPEEFERAELERKAGTLPLEKVVKKLGARPFGHATAEWRAFVRQLKEGDELWFFSTPEDMFAKKLGCQGYAIVRNGVIRHTMVTLQT